MVLGCAKNVGCCRMLGAGAEMLGVPEWKKPENFFPLFWTFINKVVSWEKAEIIMVFIR